MECLGFRLLRAEAAAVHIQPHPDAVTQDRNKQQQQTGNHGQTAPDVEKHPDTYVAYPLGLKGVVVGQGDSYESALEDVKSAIKFHIETFGLDEIDSDPPILEAFIAEARVAV